MTTKQENERLARVETKVENIESKVDGLDAKFDNLVESLDKRYAPKWVGTVMTAFISVILTAFAAALVALVIK